MDRASRLRRPDVFGPDGPPAYAPDPGSLLPAKAGSLARAQALARLMDTAVRIPGTGIRFGLDALLGLVPGGGDVAGAILSGYLVLLAVRLGAPSSVVLRMLGNVGVDTLAGAVPLLGDLFDVGWKSNTRNLALLERHMMSPSGTRAASRAVIVGVVAGLALLAAAGIAVAVLAFRALFGGPG